MDRVTREGGQEDGIAAVLSRVVSDAETVARAEIELQKARLIYKVGEARNGVVFLLAAVVVVWFALTALVVGALLMLTAVLGAIWATVIVVGVLAVIAAGLGCIGMRHIKLMSALKVSK